MNEEMKKAIIRVNELARQAGYQVKFQMRPVDIDKIHDWEVVPKVDEKDNVHPWR